MRILLTNDDGIHAPGLAALCEAVSDLGTLYVAAPADAESAISHAVTHHRTIATWPYRPANPTDPHLPAARAWAIDGRPADCVKLGLNYLAPEPIDLVLSGINAGANVGINVLYSGTVAAAREAAIHAVPAVALSLHLRDRLNIRWQAAGGHCRTTIDRLLAGPLDPRTVLNVNIPVLDDSAEPVGTRIAPISLSPACDEYHVEADDNRRHYRVANSLTFKNHIPGSDVEALFNRHITLTPLHFDPTAHNHLASWQSHFAPDAEPRA